LLRNRLRDERVAFVHSRVQSLAHLAPADKLNVEKLMDEMLEKLILEPTQRLRGEKELRKKIQNVEALRDLFLPKDEKH